MKLSALLIGLLLAMSSAVAYAGYNREYWFAGQYLGNGVDRFGYGSYDSIMPLMRNGAGTYDWQTTYHQGSPRYDARMLQPRGMTNARYGQGVTSPRYGYGTISPRYGYQFQSPSGRN